MTASPETSPLTSPTTVTTILPATGGAPVDVVHVITTLTTGGAERQLQLLTARSSHSTLTVTLYGGGPVADAMRAAGHRVVDLGATGWRKPLAPLLLARLLRRLHPRVVHVHLLSAQLFGIPAARLAGVPVVVSTEHSLMDDTIEGRPHSWWLRGLYRALERLATHTIAVSDTTGARLQRWGVRRERISVADLGIDFDALAYDVAGRQSLRAELGIDPDVLVLGAVGRLAPVKRLDRTLRAVAPLLRDGARLVVAGSGPLQDELTALTHDLGIAGQVHWLGARSDMSAVLSAFDVLVSASTDETFGMAVVEAMGAGLPVVYAECPALEELDETPLDAHRVPVTGDEPTDTGALATCVADVVAGTRPGRRAPVPVALVDRYGAQSAADRVDAVYDRLLRERGA